MRQADEAVFFSGFDRIAGFLGCSRKDVGTVKRLQNGMTNESFQFSCKDEMYVLRIPGKGSGRLIDRHNEWHVYQKLRNINLCDHPLYLSPEDGLKLTAFWPDARSCSLTNASDVAGCMALLRSCHQLKLKVDRFFDPFEHLAYYTALCPYAAQDGLDKAMLTLRAMIDKRHFPYVLAHIDPVSNNFMVRESGIRLIDWEYAAMQDPLIDIAMFMIDAYDQTPNVQSVIDGYFPEGCPENARALIYGYAAVCALLWSRWGVYQHSIGNDTGTYARRQHQCAETFLAKWRDMDGLYH